MEKSWSLWLNNRRYRKHCQSYGSEVPRLRREGYGGSCDLEEEGIDKIIALTHIGYNSAPKVGNDLLLAENVDGIDIIKLVDIHILSNSSNSVNKHRKSIPLLFRLVNMENT